MLIEPMPFDRLFKLKPNSKATRGGGAPQIPRVANLGRQPGMEEGGHELFRGGLCVDIIKIREGNGDDGGGQ